MLRITVHEKPGVLTFQLEGRLAGPDVQLLEECWRSARGRQHVPIRRLDLTDVTSIDAAGRAYLASLNCQGAEIIAHNPLTKAVIADITRRPNPD